MFCGNCGKELLNNEIYCTDCGSKIDNFGFQSNVTVQEIEPQKSVTVWEEIKTSKFILINPILFTLAFVLIWFNVTATSGLILAKLFFPFFAGTLAFVVAKRSPMFCFIISLPVAIWTFVLFIYGAFMGSLFDQGVVLPMLLVEIITLASIYLPVILVKAIKPRIEKFILPFSTIITFLMTDFVLNFSVNYIETSFNKLSARGLLKTFSFTINGGYNTPVYGCVSFLGIITLLVLWLIYRDKKPKQKTQQ